MEGRTSTRLCKWIGARPAAVLLMLMVLSVGLSACGSSSSSSGAKGSTSSVVKKEAGVFGKDVQLTVTNKSPYMLNIKICGATCEDSVDLGTGESKTATGDRVDGDIRFLKVNPGSGVCCDVTNEVYFTSENPNVGEPYISVGAFADLLKLPKWHLAEGDTRDTTFGGNVFFMARGDDTDYKVMTLTAAR